MNFSTAALLETICHAEYSEDSDQSTRTPSMIWHWTSVTHRRRLVLLTYQLDNWTVISRWVSEQHPHWPSTNWAV